MAVPAAPKMGLYLDLPSSIRSLGLWMLLLWPYILHLVIDIFTRYEGDRSAAWEALKGPIIGGVCLVRLHRNSLSHDGLFNGQGDPEAPSGYPHGDVRSHPAPFPALFQ